MALTPSTMLPLGTKAPDFELLDTGSCKLRNLQRLKSSKATVIMFICNHCPYVKHVQKQLIALAKDYQPKDIAFIAISANDAENYPEDGPKEMAKHTYPFPYLYDENQSTAKAYQAACTPDFYIFDKDLLCVYRGQLDDSRPGNQVPVTGKALRDALDNLLTDTPIDPDQKPSIGCNIKWKK
ncbi:MAG: thioredoxin family protein [Pseudomonadota bacterium]